MKKILSSLLILFLFLLGTNNVFALDVSQVSLNVEDKSSTITVLDEGIGTLEINPKIEFNVVGDYITYKLVLKNNDGKKYKVESIDDNNTNEHIKVEYDYNKELNTDNKTILITLKYDKKITDPSTELKSIKVSIKLVDEDDNTQNIDVDGGGTNIGVQGRTEDLSKTPKTGDNIKAHVWWLFISLIGLALSIIYLIKNKGKKHNKSILSILLLLTLIPTIVFASETKEIIFNINFTNDNIIIKIKYKVEFDTNGGSDIDYQTVEKNDKATKPTDPTKEHYNFVKWLDEENREYDFNTPITKDIKLTALWEEKDYTISYNTDGGSNVSSEIKKYNETFTKPTNPEKTGHNFIKWVDKENREYDFDSKAVKDIELKALWEKKDYTVTFDSNGGSRVDTQTVKYEENATKPTDPEKVGYRLTKWVDENNNEYNFDTKVTKNITLKAEWELRTYTITYDLDGGSVSVPNKIKYTIETEDFTLNNPTKNSNAIIPVDKYDFKGWTGSNGQTPQMSVTISKGSTEDKNYTAKYTHSYLVGFDAGEGTISETSRWVEENTAINNFPEVTPKTGYKLIGWTVDDVLVDEEYIVRLATGFKAKYAPVEYSITYNLNGGSADNPDKYTIETEDFTLNNPTPPTNKVFKGWIGSNGTTAQSTVKITKGTTENLEYEAVYNDLYTVTFNPDAGTMSSSDTTRIVEDGEKIGALPTVTPPEGKVFDGWYIESTQIDKDYIVTKNIEVKAKYSDPTDVTDLVDPDDPEVITDDYGNDRFTGFDPKNYIYYNCKTEPTSSWTDNDYKNSCELWRVLGTFDNVEDAQGKKEKRAKIIRDDYLPGNYAWDSSVYNINSGGGINEWSQADLMYELNGDYLDYTKTGTTTWYNGSKNKKTEPYDYKYSLSRYAQTLIKEADWWYGYTNIYNGGFSFPIMNSQQRKFMKVARVYELERTEYNVKEKTGATYDSLARGTKIFKVVGLPSLSDYGYATSGDNDESIRLGCLNSDLEYDYGVFSGKKCHMYNWLHNGTKAVWTINRLYDFPAPQNSGVWAIATKGGIVSYPASGSMVSSTTYEFYVRPTVFLKKNVVAIGGTGTKTDPYKIMLNEQ